MSHGFNDRGPRRLPRLPPIPRPFAGTARTATGDTPMTEAPAPGPAGSPKPKEVAAAPEARLEPRDKDVRVPPQRLNEFRDCISLFAGLKSKPNLERNPGTLLLRRYYPGDDVCRQGEPGNSAFYIITGPDEE